MFVSVAAYPSEHPYVPYAVHENGVFALSVGSETGFDTSYKVGQFVARMLVEQVAQSDLAPAEAIEAAFDAVGEALTQRFPAEVDFEAVGATAICVVIKDDQAFIGWIGGETAFHVLHGQVIAETKAHLWRHVHPDFPPEMAHFATRALPLDNNKPEQTVWRLQQGSQIVLATQMHLKHAGVMEDAAKVWGAAKVTIEVK